MRRFFPTSRLWRRSGRAGQRSGAGRGPGAGPAATSKYRCASAVGSRRHAPFYLRTRSLWVPIGFHFAWNTTMGVVLGLPISGARVPGLLGAASSGPEIWTGGAFGPESSAVTAALVIALAAFFVWRVAAEGRIHVPAWMRRWRAAAVPGSDPAPRPGAGR